MKVPFTKLQLYLEFLSAVLLIALFVYLVINWGSLPDQIPTHYNFSGEADKWGGKGSIWILPGSALFCYVLIGLVNVMSVKYWSMPQRGKTPVSPKAYQAVRDMLVIMKLLLIILFGYLTFCSLKGTNLGAFVLPLILIATFAVTIWGLVHIFRAGR